MLGILYLLVIDGDWLKDILNNKICQLFLAKNFLLLKDLTRLFKKRKLVNKIN